MVAAGLLFLTAGWLGSPLITSAGSQPSASMPGSEAGDEVGSFSVGKMPLKPFEGVLEPFAEVDVAPRTEGQIVSIKVKKGDRVEKDELIAQLDYEDKEAEHQRALILAQDTYELEKARLAYEKAEKDVKRSRSLAEQGFEAPQVVERYELEFAAASRNLTHQEAMLRYHKLTARVREIELGKTRVVAPISGIIAELYLDEGEMALVYGRYPERPAVAKIVNIDKLVLNTHVDARLIGSLKKGQQLPVEVKLFPGESFVGTLDFIAPLIERRVADKVVVELVLDNPGHRLLPGMHGRAVLEAMK